MRAETPGPAPLTTAQRWLAVATGLGTTGIAILAGVGSFSAVAAVAQAHGFEHPGQVPLVVDLGIFALILADLLLTWLGMPFAPLRWLPWLFVIATVWFNAAASWGDPLGMAMHAAAPVLLVTWVEAVRHATRTRARMAQRRHIEGSPLGRWLLFPIATARLWRVQQLWHVTSYADALALERRRLLAIARMRAEHGRLWRWKAPVMERLVLRFGLEAEAATPQTEGDASPPAGVEVSRGDSPGTPALPAPSRSSPAKPRASRARAGTRPAPKSRQAREFVLGEWAQGRQPTGGEIDRRFQVSEGYGRRLLRELTASNGHQTGNGHTPDPAAAATSDEEGGSA